MWWIAALNLAFGLVFTILVPPFRGPDEREQVDMVLRSHTGYLDPSEKVVPTDAILGTGSLSGPRMDPDLRYRPPMPYADAVPRRDRPSFEDLRLEVASAAGSTPQPSNHLTQHPPLHYVAVGTSSRLLTMLTPAEAWSWDRELWLYRLHSVALVAALPLLASSAALVLGATRRAAAAAAAFMLLSPMHTFIGSVVNNDAMVILGSGVAVVGAVAHLRDGTTKTAVVAAVGGAVAALAKSTGVAMLPWVALVVAVVAVSSWRDGRRREAVRNLGVTAALCLVGASWHLANLVRFGDPQPTGVRRRIVEDADTPLGKFATTWFDQVSGTFWGRPATRTGVVLDSWVTGGLTIVVVVLLIAAVWKGWRNLGVTMLTVLCAAQVLLMLRTNLASYLRSGEFDAFQGRYLFSLLVPLAALTSFALAQWLRPRWQGLALMVVAGLGATLHAVISWSMLIGYWEGDSLRSRLDSVLAWSPLPHAAGVLVLLTPVLVAGAWAASSLIPRWRQA